MWFPFHWRAFYIAFLKARGRSAFRITKGFSLSQIRLAHNNKVTERKASFIRYFGLKSNKISYNFWLSCCTCKGLTPADFPHTYVCMLNVILWRGLELSVRSWEFLLAIYCNCPFIWGARPHRRGVENIKIDPWICALGTGNGEQKIPINQTSGRITLPDNFHILVTSFTEYSQLSKSNAQL